MGTVLSTLYLTVQVKPTASAPERTIWEMLTLATRLGIEVVGDVNGIEVIASPGGTLEEAYALYEKAREAKV